MKRLFILLLAAVMLLSLCACSNTQPAVVDTPSESAEAPAPVEVENSAEETTTAFGGKPWNALQSVDEFGDVTANSVSYMAAMFDGTFSNSATSNSSLTVSAFILFDPDCRVSFRLLEYDRTPASYTDRDEMILKTKVDDTITEYALSGQAPNEDVVMANTDEAVQFVNTLLDGKDIRCIIEIGNSTYNFTVKSGDAVNAWNEIYYSKLNRYASADEISESDLELYLMLADSKMEAFGLEYFDHASGVKNITSATRTGDVFFVQMINDSDSHAYPRTDRIAVVYRIEGEYTPYDSDTTYSEFYGYMFIRNVTKDFSTAFADNTGSIFFGMLDYADLDSRGVEILEAQTGGFNYFYGTNVDFVATRIE